MMAPAVKDHKEIFETSS